MLRSIGLFLREMWNRLPTLAKCLSLNSSSLPGTFPFPITALPYPSDTVEAFISFTIVYKVVVVLISNRRLSANMQTTHQANFLPIIPLSLFIIKLNFFGIFMSVYYIRC